MINHCTTHSAAPVAHCCSFIMEPDLGELLSDPMTLALMKADRVDPGALDALIAGARDNLRWHRPN